MTMKKNNRESTPKTGASKKAPKSNVDIVLPDGFHENASISDNGGNYGPLRGGFVFCENPGGIENGKPVVAFDLGRLLADEAVLAVLPKYEIDYRSLPTDVINALEEEGVLDP